jgi:hypothetical protein
MRVFEEISNWLITNKFSTWIISSSQTGKEYDDDDDDDDNKDLIKFYTYSCANTTAQRITEETWAKMESNTYTQKQPERNLTKRNETKRNVTKTFVK